MLEVRSRKAELLDGPDCDPQTALRSYKLMRVVNRFAGGTRAVTDFLSREVTRNGKGHTMRIVDLGCGVCDIPLAVARWAKGRGLDVSFTCIDTNETALAVAGERIEASDIDSIRLECADINDFEPAEEYDYAIGSMFFHHFADEHIVALVGQLRRYVRSAVIINDLRRSALSYACCRVMFSVLPRGVRHDALLSIRKGFRRKELAELFKHIEGVDVHVHILSFSRLVGIVRFRNGGCV